MIGQTVYKLEIIINDGKVFLECHIKNSDGGFGGVTFFHSPKFPGEDKMVDYINSLPDEEHKELKSILKKLGEQHE